MIHDDFTLSPYERRLFGPRGEFLFRQHDTLPDVAARVIRRRDHPAWSSQRVEIRIGA